jgi:transcriptional regulator NrdR family protein
MTCPQCNVGVDDSKVLETRMVLGGANAGMRRRRRKCHKCGTRYATYQPVGKAEVAIINTMSEAAVAAQLYKAA